MEVKSNVIEFKRQEDCPPDLQWAIPLIEHQKTQSFKDKIGYEITLGRQEARRRYQKMQEEKLKKSTMRK